MGTRQSFYVESLSESSTTSASEQVKTTLTFIPDANSDYWLIASGAFTCVTTDNHEGQVDLAQRSLDRAVLPGLPGQGGEQPAGLDRVLRHRQAQLRRLAGPAEHRRAVLVFAQRRHHEDQGRARPGDQGRRRR